MALIPTTFLKNPDFSKEMLRGVANAQMGILLNQMRLGSLKCGRRVVEFSTGVKITCTVNYNDRRLDVFVPENLGGESFTEEYVVGFLCHPGVAHEYDQVQATEEIRKGNRVVYHDNNVWHAQKFVVRVTTTDLFGNVIALEEVGNEYGNVDWKGPKQDPAKDPLQHYRKVLTWKGPPSRYWPVGQFTIIDGVTVTDHIIEGLLQDTIYTTPFSGNIYEHGLVAAKMPHLYYPLGLNNNTAAQVLGAAYREADEKLIVVVKTCYNAYPYAKAPGQLVSTWQVRYQGKFFQEWLANKNGADAQVALLGTGYAVAEVRDPGRGYWFEVLVKEQGVDLDGWNRVLRVPTNTNLPNTNWFFSENGLQACTVMYDYLHKITLSFVGQSTICSYSTESVGKFNVDVNTLVVNTQVSETREILDAMPIIQTNEGPVAGQFYAFHKYDPEYGVYVAPLLNKIGFISTSVVTYNDTKSGEIIVAADYKENQLVTMTAVLSGSQQAELTTYRYGDKYQAAVWGRSNVNYHTVTELRCQCTANQRIGYYYYAPGKRYEVYWGATYWPLDTQTLEEHLSMYYDAGMCNLSFYGTCMGQCLENFQLRDDFVFVNGVLGQLSNGGRIGNPFGESSPLPVGLHDNGDNAYRYSLPAVFCDGKYYQHSLGFSLANIVCTDYLSDSWKQNLIDWLGNPVEVPATWFDGDKEYYVKVYLVRDQSCSVAA